MDDIKEIQNEIILYDNNVETSLVTVDPEDLEKKGYVKLSKGAFERIDFLAQYIPGHVAQKMTADAANKAMSEMADNAFKVVVKDGMHLGKSSTMKGAFKGLLFSNEGNKLKSSAELIPLAPETIPSIATPQLMLGFFNALSFVTGQYFLSSINTTLTSHTKGIEKLLAHLELDKKSEIKAETDTLDRALAFLDYIMENDIQRQSASTDFKAIKRSSLSKIYFFIETIKDLSKGIHENAKPEDVRSILYDLKKYYPQYWYAVRNYCLAAALDAIVSEIDDPNYLNSVEADIRRQVSGYQTSIDNTIDAYDSFLDGSHELNKKRVANGGLKGIYEMNSMPSGVRLGTMAVDLIDMQRVEASNQKKARSRDDKTRFLETCDNPIPLNETVKMIREYRKIRNNPVELIVTKENAYIKYFDDEEL